MGKRLVVFFLLMSLLLYPMFSLLLNQHIVVQSSQKPLTNYDMGIAHVLSNKQAPQVHQTLPVYFEPDLIGVPYVDLNEFYNFILPSLIQKQNFYVDYKGNEWRLVLNKEKEVIINFKDKTLLISDVKLLDEVSSLYQNSIQSFQIQMLEPTKPLSISLDAYQIPIDYQQGHYLVPLYLANFLLSGYDLDVVYGYNGDYQLMVSTPEDYFNQQTLDYWSDFNFQLNAASQLQASKHSVNFLNLVMEQFYGLNQLGTPFDSVVATDDVQSNHHLMQQAISQLGDLHTGFIYPSFFERLEQEDEVSSVLYEKEYRLAYSKAQCNATTLSIASYHEIDDVLYIEIYGFDETLVRFMNDMEPIIDKYDDVFIDIRCNSGGYITYIATVMKQLATKDWSLKSSDLYGGVNEWQFISSREQDDKQFYLVTSSYTYSAANLLAAVVADTQSAMIVGEQSFGGAAALDFLSLADGSVLTYSGPFYIFSTERFKDIEQGVPVDLPIDFYELANVGASNDAYKKWESMILSKWKSGYSYYQSPKTYDTYEAYLRRIIEYVKEEK